MPEDIFSLSVEERAARYRVRAEEALITANRTTDGRLRGQLLLIAQGWTNLADITERSLLDSLMNGSRTKK